MVSHTRVSFSKAGTGPGSWQLMVSSLSPLPSTPLSQNGLGEADHGSDPPSYIPPPDSPGCSPPPPAPVSIKTCSSLSFLPPDPAWHLLNAAELREAGMGRALRGHTGPAWDWVPLAGRSPRLLQTLVSTSACWGAGLPVPGLSQLWHQGDCDSIPIPLQVPSSWAASIALPPPPNTHPCPSQGPRSTVCGRTWRGSQTQSLNSHFGPHRGLWAGHPACWASAFPSAERGWKTRSALPSPGMAML